MDYICSFGRSFAKCHPPFHSLAFKSLYISLSMFLCTYTACHCLTFYFPENLLYRQQSGAGFIFSKLTVDILRNALGSEVLDLIATERTPEGGISTAQVAEGTKAAALQAMGAKDIGEELKVGTSVPSLSQVPRELIEVTSSWRFLISSSPLPLVQNISIQASIHITPRAHVLSTSLLHLFFVVANHGLAHVFITSVYFCCMQVIVSGPTGFVFYVESLLAELGVPFEAIILLD